jgi:hypothetical protein
VRVIVAWVSLAVAAACLTVLFLGMRSVMEIGGFCATGGPYVIENPCPEEAAWMMPVSILLGLLALGVHVVASFGLPGPRFALLAWPALFLSLGWNFWEYGLDPPGGDSGSGTAVGWIVCGVVFVLMGGLPLVWLLASPTGRRSLLWADGASSADRPTVRGTAASISPLAVRQQRYAGPTPPPRVPPRPSGTEDIDADDFTARLERLAAMYRRGDLSAAEFEAAKAKLLTEGDGS